jgi:DNA invertase Pin-like site-specific DNA recombinase
MTRRTIPGLQRDLYAALLALDQPEVECRVRALSAQGMSEREIARLTGLHLLVVRRILSGPTLHLERGGA